MTMIDVWDVYDLSEEDLVAWQGRVEDLLADPSAPQSAEKLRALRDAIAQEIDERGVTGRILASLEVHTPAPEPWAPASAAEPWGHDILQRPYATPSSPHSSSSGRILSRTSSGSGVRLQPLPQRTPSVLPSPSALEDAGTTPTADDVIRGLLAARAAAGHTGRKLAPLGAAAPGSLPSSLPQGGGSSGELRDSPSLGHSSTPSHSVASPSGVVPTPQRLSPSGMVSSVLQRAAAPLGRPAAASTSPTHTGTSPQIPQAPFPWHSSGYSGAPHAVERPAQGRLNPVRAPPMTPPDIVYTTSVTKTKVNTNKVKRRHVKAPEGVWGGRDPRQVQQARDLAKKSEAAGRVRDVPRGGSVQVRGVAAKEPAPGQTGGVDGHAAGGGGGDPGTPVGVAALPPSAVIVPSKQAGGHVRYSVLESSGSAPSRASSLKTPTSGVHEGPTVPVPSAEEAPPAAAPTVEEQREATGSVGSDPRHAPEVHSTDEGGSTAGGVWVGEGSERGGSPGSPRDEEDDTMLTASGAIAGQEDHPEAVASADGGGVLQAPSPTQRSSTAVPFSVQATPDGPEVRCATATPTAGGGGFCEHEVPTGLLIAPPGRGAFGNADGGAGADADPTLASPGSSVASAVPAGPGAVLADTDAEDDDDIGSSATHLTPEALRGPAGPGSAVASDADEVAPSPQGRANAGAPTATAAPRSPSVADTAGNSDGDVPSPDESEANTEGRSESDTASDAAGDEAPLPAVPGRDTVMAVPVVLGASTTPSAAAFLDSGVKSAPPASEPPSHPSSLAATPNATPLSLRRKEPPIPDYTKLFPTFASLWVPYDRTAAPSKAPVDERKVVEEAGKDMLCWALGILEEGDSDDSDDGEDDDTGRPSARNVKARRRDAVTRMEWQEVFTRLQELLADADAREALQAAGPGMEFATDKSRMEVYELITAMFEGKDGWCMTDSGVLCNYVWTWRKPRPRSKYVFCGQRLNHYPGTSALTRKDALKRSLQRYRRMPGRAGEAFNIYPETFTLPNESSLFIDATGLTRDRIRLQQMASGTEGHESTTCGVWIVKPYNMSRARGIEIITHPASIDHAEPMVVQRYIANPFLIHGHKFDMRLYVLVPSFQPLEAYVSTLGFARFASQPFTMDPSSFANRMVHLTNTSVNEEGVPPFFCTDGCSKWGLDKLEREWPRFSSLPWRTVWARVVECIIKCVVAANTSIDNHACCFELLGFDVMLDDACNPWVLEVNASPSMEVATHLDQRVKGTLMRQCCELMDPPAFDRFALMEVLARRMGGMSGKRARSRAVSTSKKTELNRDIHSIFAGATPAALAKGPSPPTDPDIDGPHFQRIAPSPMHDKVCRMMRV